MFKRIIYCLVTTLGLLAAGGSAMAQAAPAHVVNGILVGKNDMTLYTFDRDVAGSGKSVCDGECAALWPPLTAPAGATAEGGYSVTRDDGSKQFAYKGKPLYYLARDTKPGETSGNGFYNLWKTATP